LEARRHKAWKPIGDNGSDYFDIGSEFFNGSSEFFDNGSDCGDNGSDFLKDLFHRNCSFVDKLRMYLFLCEFQSFIFSRGVFLAWTYAQSEIVAEIP